MPTKCCWVIHGSLTSERKASTSPSSFINHSTLLLNRALKRQAPCLYMDFEVRALDKLRTRRRVGSARRRGNHMHDHSRFQRDINDVTGVSLSLSLSLSQKSLTHNIGSASALPIIQRKRDIDGSDVTIVALKLAMNLHFPLPKSRTIGDELTLSLAKNSHFSILCCCCCCCCDIFSLHTSRLSLHGEVTMVYGGAEIRNEFTLSIAKFFFALRLCSPSFKWHEPRDEGSKTQDK